jgi:hypothetical protein
MTQMTQNLTAPDRAIDAVAKGMTHGADDPLLAARIVASLPERTTWPGWWMPRFAGLAALFVVAASSMLLINRQPAPALPALLPATSGFMVAALPSAPAPLGLGTKPLELLEPLEPVKPDHEYSLPALAVETLIEPARLAIVDLPLSGEFPEPY